MCSWPHVAPLGVEMPVGGVVGDGAAGKAGVPAHGPTILLEGASDREQCCQRTIGYSVAGLADMRILHSERRAEHARRIRVGTQGCVVEGSRKMAVIDIVAALDLFGDDSHLSSRRTASSAR